MAAYRVLIEHRTREGKDFPRQHRREVVEADTSWSAISKGLQKCADLPRDLLVSMTVGRIGDPGIKG